MGKTSDAIAEGVSIAAAAARLVVRNHILVETIARGGQFDPEVVGRFAHDTLIELAEEQEAAGELARVQRKTAWGKHTDPDGTHDYRDRDMRNLRKRRNQYLGVARALRAQAEDPEKISELVEAARDAAWGDVETNLQRRLTVEGMRADADPDYDMMRGARMQALRLVDLPRLASHRRHVGSRGADERDPDDDDDDGGEDAGQSTN